ncbi:hypothetical protein GCM10028791_17180 [Echinicola sediminis]
MSRFGHNKKIIKILNFKKHVQGNVIALVMLRKAIFSPANPLKAYDIVKQF